MSFEIILYMLISALWENLEKIRFCLVHKLIYVSILSNSGGVRSLDKARQTVMTFSSPIIALFSFCSKHIIFQRHHLHFLYLCVSVKSKSTQSSGSLVFVICNSFRSGVNVLWRISGVNCIRFIKFCHN